MICIIATVNSYKNNIDYLYKLCKMVLINQSKLPKSSGRQKKIFRAKYLKAVVENFLFCQS